MNLGHITFSRHHHFLRCTCKWTGTHVMKSTHLTVRSVRDGKVLVFMCASVRCGHAQRLKWLKVYTHTCAHVPDAAWMHTACTRSSHFTLSGLFLLVLRHTPSSCTEALAPSWSNVSSLRAVVQSSHPLTSLCTFTIKIKPIKNGANVSYEAHASC